MSTEKLTLVLFSGGRDSSSAAIEMARNGYKVKLFTFQAGLPELTGFLGDSAPDIRHKELLSALTPDVIDSQRAICGSTYLLRKLAIEKTNATHVVYPLALALAVHSEAIIYALKHGIKNVTCGYSGYQAGEERYVEQHMEYFELTKDFYESYGITLHAPVHTKTKGEVMDILERYDVSSNSLENKSLFGAVAFDISKAKAFWDESLPICREYIASKK